MHKYIITFAENFKDHTRATVEVEGEMSFTIKEFISIQPGSTVTWKFQEVFAIPDKIEELKDVLMYPIHTIQSIRIKSS